MAKVRGVPPSTAPARLATLLSYRYNRDGSAVVQKWPRKRPRAEQNPVTAAQVARWDMAQEWVKAPEISEYSIAARRTHNTAFYVRDLLISSMYGNSIAWPGWGWRAQLAADIQALLDTITSVEGSIIYRGPVSWEALVPGATPGEVLTTGGSGAAPSWAPVSGGAGGLFGPLLSATPTQSGTGFTSSLYLPSGAAVVDNAVGMAVSCPAQGSAFTTAAVIKAAPAATFGVRALIGHTAVQSPFSGPYFGFSDGTKVHGVWPDVGGTYVIGLSAAHGGSESTLASFPFASTDWLTWWQLRVTSTHFFIETSVDGVSWRVVQSGTLASGYLGASGYNHVFFGTMSYSQPGTSTLLSYSEGP